MGTIKVVVYGAAGRVGQEVVRAVSRDPGMQLVGAVDVKPAAETLTLPDGARVPFSADLSAILASCRPDVIVDFTIAKATMPAVRLAAQQGVNMVIGTTGLTAADNAEIEKLAAERRIGVVVASNFALGAVLMMHLAKIAGKYLDYAEIIEMHHERKADAPSGTSLTTARGMAAARGKPFLQPAAKEPQPSRGQTVEGISLHSVRLPGLMAHQEVILGGDGQTLRIRHDQISREAFMPGVLLAVREVVKKPGVVYGLDKLLGLA